MLTLVIVYLAYFVWVQRTDGDKDKWSSTSLLAKALLGLFPAMFALIPAMLIGLFVHKTPLLTDTIQIYSLRGGTSTGGSFILGSGSIGTSQAYYYYTRDSDGSLNPQTLADEEDNIRVIEETREGGIIEVYENQPTNSLLGLFVIVVDHSQYIIRVPLGSLEPGLNF